MPAARRKESTAGPDPDARFRKGLAESHRGERKALETLNTALDGYLARDDVKGAALASAALTDSAELTPHRLVHWLTIGFLGTAGNPGTAAVYGIGDNGAIFFPVVPSVAPQDYAFFAPAKAYFTQGKQVSITASVQPKTVGETCFLNGRVTGYLVDN